MGGAAREARLPHESRAPSDADAACATTSGSSRTSPKCVRCRNHNEVSLLSGHKRFCRFRHCVCRNCQRTAKRQKKMAKQIATRRRKRLEEQRAERGEPVPAATPPSPSTSSVDSADPPTVPSRWLPYSESSERSRHGAYEQKVSSTSSSTSGFSSIHSHAASQYAASCASPTGSVISVTALTDEDCQQPSNQRLRLAEMGTRRLSPFPETVTRRSPSFAGVETGSRRHSPAETVTRRLSPFPGAETGTFPVPDLEAVARLTGMVRRHGVDTETLLYVILNIVCPNVDEAYNRILNAQEEVRSLRNSSSPITPPPLVTGRAGESSSGSPTPPALYRTLPGHQLPPPPHHQPTPVMMPRAILGTTYYPAHLPFIGPIPTRMTLAGLTPPFSHLASFEEQYRSRNLPTAPLSLANVEESRRFPSM